MFATAIGSCGICWGDRGVTRVRLPDPSRESIRRQLARGVEETVPPPYVLDAIAGMVALLAGEPRDLRSVPVDLRGVPAFGRAVYGVARAVPPGRTLTYGHLAGMLHAPGAARAVGRALGQNPIPIIIPCHRIVAAGGRSGGFSAPGGSATKLRMLAIEGAGEPTLF